MPKVFVPKKSYLILLPLLLFVVACSTPANINKPAKLEYANFTESILPPGWRILQPPNYYASTPGFSYFLQNDNERLGALLFVNVYDKPYQLKYAAQLTGSMNLTIGTANCVIYNHETGYPKSTGPNWIDINDSAISLNVTETLLECAKNNAHLDLVIHSLDHNKQNTSTTRSALAITESVFRKLGQN